MELITAGVGVVWVTKSGVCFRGLTVYTHEEQRIQPRKPRLMKRRQGPSSLRRES